LLPELEGYPKVHGVNCLDQGYQKSDTIVGKCCSSDDCNSIYGKLYTDGKFYCWRHTNEKNKMLIKEQVQKAAQEKKQAKLKELEEKKQAKLKELEEKKLAKLQKKQQQEPKDEENAVVLFSCIHVLMTGKNKGNVCGKKCLNGTYCKTHAEKYAS
jgi:hypothetical protein